MQSGQHKNACATARQRACGLTLLLAAGAVYADEIGTDGARTTPPDKWGYTLFNPVPRALLRELSTDRPDQTESPYTVDAGHFQLESDLVSAVFDDDRAGGANLRTTAWGTSLNLKAGLLNNVDVQFMLDPYVDARVDDRVAHRVNTASGFGDVQTRLKVNLWGNDGGQTALGLMPFVKWPLPESGLRNGKTEGGVILPLALALPAGWGLGAMTEFDFVSDGAGGHDTQYFNTITLGHDIIGKLSGYVEFASLLLPESGAPWLGQVDVGFTYGLTANTQFDIGCNFGVTPSAPDFNPFVGFSYRF